MCIDFELTYELRGGEDVVSVSERQRNTLNEKGCRNSGNVNKNRFKVIVFQTSPKCVTFAMLDRTFFTEYSF